MFLRSHRKRLRESPETRAEYEREGAAGASAAPLNLETTFAQGEESETSIPSNASPESATPVALLTAPLDRSGASVRRGGTYRVDVVVRTRKLGHFFPGGTVDAFDCWLELKAVDDKGETIFWSGRTEDDGKGPVDPGAHFYRSLQIDAHGNPINKRNAWATRAAVYARLIPPGAADTVHFRMQIPRGRRRAHPPDRASELPQVRLVEYGVRFRGRARREGPGPAGSPNFDDAHYVFTGDPSSAGRWQGDPVAADCGNGGEHRRCECAGAIARRNLRRNSLDAGDWTRWNDYGIGLFLQGDLSGRGGSIRKSDADRSKNPDGWVNLGRARVQEGNLPAARQVLEHALSLNPNLARAHFFYAKMLRNEGHYDEAAEHLRIVLAQYPRDRVVHDDLGRIYFLQRHYDEAVKEFKRHWQSIPKIWKRITI